MYESAPQKQEYILIKKLNKIKKYLYYFLIIISITVAFKSQYESYIGNKAIDVLIILYLFVIIVFSLLSFILDYELMPNAQRLTRNDFFDNSFNTKFIHDENSKSYYTNETIDFGIYKMVVNLFESCFYTHAILEKMRFKKIVSTIIMSCSLIPMFYYGVKETYPIAIITIQMVLSVFFIGGLIRLLIFYKENNKYFSELKTLFSTKNFKTNIDNYQAQIIKLYTDYESNKAWSYTQLDSNIYDELDKELEKKWILMKQKYNIQ